MTEPIFSSEHAELRASIPRGLSLIVAMQGLSDAGGLISQLEDYIWEHTEPQEVIRFNADLLLDYRARRPVITFDEDHLVDYSPDELVLALARDELGAPFLVLTGYEPDYRWEAFIDAVLLLVHEFEVSVTVWAHALPMPVPHTRPIRMTVSGSREELIAAHSVWKPTTRLSASAGHVLEYRLHSLGEEVVGFAHLVPHYLANTEYPDVLLTALNAIMEATGLMLPTDPVRKAAEAFRERVEAQISENEESIEMVRTLEQRYDEYMAGPGSRSPLVGEDGSIPTAEQIASELERFLAQQRDEGEEHPEKLF